MKQSFPIQRLQRLSGICSATCVKLRSAVKFNGRTFFALLIAFFLVPVLPVHANVVNPISGVINLEPDTLGIRRNSLTENTIYGFDSVPATFDLSEDTYRFSWSSMTAYTGFYSTVTESGKELSFQLNFGDGNGDLFVSWDSLYCKPYFLARFADDSSQLIDFTFSGEFELYVDGSRVYHRTLTDDVIPSIDWEGIVSRYVEIRITTLYDSINVVDVEDASILNQYFSVYTSGLTVNDESVVIEDISVSIKNIEQDLGDIKDTVGNVESSLGDLNDIADSINSTVTNIENGVVEINGTVTDMSEQLQNPDSNIWQSGASVIKDSVKELFVPSEEDALVMFTEAGELFEGKVGDVAQLFNAGLDGGGRIIGEFTGGGRDSGIDFPGITVKLPNIGEYVIVPPMNVSDVFRTRVFEIFQDALGSIIVIICAFSAIHLAEDLVICLISGVSFWGFVRSKHL